MGRVPKALLFACAAILLTPAVALAAGPPQISASWVENVSTTGATLWAEVNPNGFSTEYRFEYITDAAYKANPSGEPFLGAVKTKTRKEGPAAFPPVHELVQGLAFATAYHYRLVASNPEGTVIGPEHVLTTEETGAVFRLPDNRGWELVSPVDKSGGAIAAPESLFGGGDIQAALVALPDPAAPLITYGSSTAFGAGAGAPPANQYVSRRTGSGWSSENVSTPLDSAAYGDEPDGAPYRLFSADLSRAILFGGLPCRGGLEGCPAPNPPLAGSGAPDGYMAYYLRDNAHGTLTSLLSAADVAHSAVSPEAFEVAFAGASPDLAHIVLSSCAALTEGATEVPQAPAGCDPQATNLYHWSGGALTQINLLPGDSTGTPGAELAAPVGAISADGSRIYWSEGGDLYLREGIESARVDEAVGGGGVFQAASADGAIAFFTKASHLYRYDSGSTTDLTPSGGVQGVLGASADGGYVYYQGATDLERWHEGVTTPVAPGADAAVASDFPPATGMARVSADGSHLAFLSDVELDGFDNIDAHTKQPDAMLYLFGPPPAGGPAELVCASCNPTGERPQGPALIPGSLVNGTTRAYRPRVLSAGGARLFFDTKDVLVQHDTNSHPDTYEWEAEGTGDCQRSPGCVNLISSGRGTEGASFLDATADGSDVFFITSESLIGADPPGSVDAYDARVNGGFAAPPKEEICLGDACQSLPSAPEDPTPGTLTPSSGNPSLRFFSPRSRKPHLRRHHSRHGKGKRHAGGRR